MTDETLDQMLKRIEIAAQTFEKDGDFGMPIFLRDIATMMRAQQATYEALIKRIAALEEKRDEIEATLRSAHIETYNATTKLEHCSLLSGLTNAMFISLPLWVALLLWVLS